MIMTLKLCFLSSVSVILTQGHRENSFPLVAVFSRLDCKICAKANACTHKHTQALEHSPTYNTCAHVQLWKFQLALQSPQVKLDHLKFDKVDVHSTHFGAFPSSEPCLWCAPDSTASASDADRSFHIPEPLHWYWAHLDFKYFARRESPRYLVTWASELVSLFAISAHHISTYLSWCTTFNCKLWTDSQAFCILSR